MSPVHILLAEDNPADAELTLASLAESKVANQVHVVEDGVEAMRFLRREGPYQGQVRPDLVLLDLNMPRMDGREVLAAVKDDAELRSIPVVVLTSSEAEADIVRSYELHANCFISKPVDLRGLETVVQAIESFWFEVVKLPRG